MDDASSIDEVNAKKYLSEVTSIVEASRMCLVRVNAYTDDRMNAGNGVIYSTVDNIVYIFVPYSLVHGTLSLTVTFDSGVTIDGYLYWMVSMRLHFPQEDRKALPQSVPLG